MTGNGWKNIDLLFFADRTSSFLHQRSTTRVVVLHRFTSLDDAIDVLSRGKQPAVNALYLFAGPREAKYLSQYAASHASFDNHIPAQLIGMIRVFFLSTSFSVLVVNS